MRLATLIGVCALTAPVLAGCVVYSHEQGETVRVNVGNAAGHSAALNPTYAIRGAVIRDGALVVRVDSNGCTDTASFEVVVEDGAPADIGLNRIKDDNCRAHMPDGVELRWTFAELGLEPGTSARVLNPLK